MHAPSKQIVIAGYFGFGSAGDEAILDSLCKVLRSAAQPIRPVAISGDSAKTAEAYEVEVCDWSDAATISEAVRSAEAVMIAGRSLFTASAAAVVTAGMATSWPALLVPAALSAIHHKPLLLYGIGFDGPVPEGMRQSLLAVCRAASLIMVCDQITQDLLTSVGINASKIAVTADRAKTCATLLDTLAQQAPWDATCCAELIALGLGPGRGVPSAEINAVIEGLQKQVQEAERMRSDTLAALNLYQAQVDAELRIFRKQRAWKVMLYLRKAYTVLVRGIQTGRFPSVAALISLVIAPSKNLDAYDLRLPVLKRAMPSRPLDVLRGPAGQFETTPAMPAPPGTPQVRRRDVPRQQNYDVLVLPLFEFDYQFGRPQELAIQFARAGHRVFWISPSRTAPDNQLYEAVGLQPSLWEIRLRSRLPDVNLEELEPKLVQDALGCIEGLYRDFAISECCTLALLPYWRRLGLALRDAFDTRLLYHCTDEWQTAPALSAFNLDQEPRIVAEADVLVVSGRGLLESHRAAGREPVLVSDVSDLECWRVMDEAIRKAFPLVSILIVTHDSAEYVQLCMEALLRNTSYPSYEVVVVDNASRDRTGALLEESAARNPRLRVIRSDENLGFAAANNLAAGLASGEYLVLLNIDTIPSPGWIMRLVRHCVKHADIGLIVPVTNNIGNEAKVRVPYVNLEEMEEFAITLGADRMGESLELSMGPLFCALLPRALWNRVGPLDERFGIGMFEDDDFSLRIRKAGFRIVAAEDCFVHHFGQGSFAKLAPGYYHEVFAANRRLFEEKWQTAWEPPKYRPGVSAEEGKFRPSDFARG